MKSKSGIYGVQKQFDCYVKRTLRFIARNLLRQVARKRKAEPEICYFNDLREEPSYCNIPYNKDRRNLRVGEREESDRKDSLKTALDELTEKERQVIVMLYYKGMTPDEIAEEMGMTRDAVYMCKFRSVNKMREYFRGIENEDGM